MSDALKTAQRRDILTRLGMAEWQIDMILNGADTGLIQDIVRDQRVPSTAQLPRAPSVRVEGAIPITPGVSLNAGRGWVEPKPIEDWKPPGLDVMEGMMDAEDAKWRADRKREFGG